MTRCPDAECNAEAAHVGILLPWKPGGKVQVLHQCPDCDEYGLFFEDSQDPVAIAMKARASLETLERENGSVQTKLEGS